MSKSKEKEPLKRELQTGMTGLRSQRDRSYPPLRRLKFQV